MAPFVMMFLDAISAQVLLADCLSNRKGRMKQKLKGKKSGKENCYLGKKMQN